MNLPTFFTTVLSIGAIVLGGPPATKKLPVSDTFHGVKVSESYRWLEDASDSEVSAWSDVQNAHARSVLDELPNVASADRSTLQP